MGTDHMAGIVDSAHLETAQSSPHPLAPDETLRVTQRRWWNISHHVILVVQCGRNTWPEIDNRIMDIHQPRRRKSRIVRPAILTVRDAVEVAVGIVWISFVEVFERIR